MICLEGLSKRHIASYLDPINRPISFGQPVYATLLSIMHFFQIAADLFWFSTMTAQLTSMRQYHGHFKCMRCNMSHSMRDPTMLVKQMNLEPLDLLIVVFGRYNQQVSGQSSCIFVKIADAHYCFCNIFGYIIECSPYKFCAH